MRPLIAPFALLLVATPALAQWEPPDQVLQVRIKGEGPWTVRCDWQGRNGKSKSREANGKDGDWERIHVSDPQGGNCTYRAAPDQPLTIRLKSPLYLCTLPEPEEGQCEQTFPAGASGVLEIARRD